MERHVQEGEQNKTIAAALQVNFSITPSVLPTM